MHHSISYNRYAVNSINRLGFAQWNTHESSSDKSRFHRFITQIGAIASHDLQLRIHARPDCLDTGVYSKG